MNVGKNLAISISHVNLFQLLNKAKSLNKENIIVIYVYMRENTE